MFDLEQSDVPAASKEDGFSATQFIAELEHRGIDVGSNFVTRFFGAFVIGVGQKCNP